MADHTCFDCGHLVANHSGEYPGWDSRTKNFTPTKQTGTGCLVVGCPCRRWFEIHSAAPTKGEGG